MFQVGEDGLDSAAFLDGVRRLVIANTRLDSVVSAAIVRHIDFLLAQADVSSGDQRIDQRAKQIEDSLRNVLALGDTAATPNTTEFKRIIGKGKQ